MIHVTRSLFILHIHRLYCGHSVFFARQSFAEELGSAGVSMMKRCVLSCGEKDILDVSGCVEFGALLECPLDVSSVKGSTSGCITFYYSNLVGRVYDN